MWMVFVLVQHVCVVSVQKYIDMIWNERNIFYVELKE